MGADDANAPGKPLAPEAARAGMGRNAENARALAARMPKARAIVLEGVGHLVHLEAADRFNRELLAFLGGKLTAPSSGGARIYATPWIRPIRSVKRGPCLSQTGRIASRKGVLSAIVRMSMPADLIRSSACPS